MDHSFIIAELSGNRALFEHLFKNVVPEQILWKPEQAKWSLLEVACHLYDEEREDFRTRIKYTLETPERPFPPIDPTAWVKERKYADQNFEETVIKFLQERTNSVEWLNSLTFPSWKNEYVHPKLGAMSAELLLANWLAHDHLHIRQITKLKYDYLKHSSGVRLDYAGEW